MREEISQFLSSMNTTLEKFSEKPFPTACANFLHMCQSLVCEAEGFEVDESMLQEGQVQPSWQSQHRSEMEGMEEIFKETDLTIDPSRVHEHLNLPEPFAPTAEGPKESLLLALHGEDTAFHWLARLFGLPANDAGEPPAAISELQVRWRKFLIAKHIKAQQLRTTIK